MSTISEYLKSSSDLLPSKRDYLHLRSSWRHDLLAGVTVGIVALPLALAFGVSSGVGAAAGIITAVVAGLVAALFGGSHLQVSGPTGAMTVVLVPIVERYGVSAVFALSILAGIFVTLMGLFRWGKAVNFLPWPVVEGFTVGIATVIALQQVPLAIGVPKPKGENTAIVAFEAVRNWDAKTSAAALAITATAALLMAGVAKWRRNWPASLIAVAAVTLIAQAADLQIPRIGELPAAVPHFQIPVIDFATIKTLIGSAVAVAALAAIESLLSAKVADGLSDEENSEPDRELVGQGLANIASGFFGGMPATGAIARTAVNARTGARTRLSAAFHAIVLLAAVVFASPLLSRIPLAALAGVLLVTAFKMVERHTALSLLKSNRSDASVFAATAAATVLLDLIVAVELGIAIAVVLAIRTLSAGSRAVAEPLNPEMIDDQTELAMLKKHIGIYRVDGALFFGAAQRFLEDLTDVNHLKVMILRLDFCAHIDATGGQVLHEVISDLRQRGVVVLLKSVKARHRPVLQSAGVFDLLRSADDCYDHLADAVAEAERIVRS